MNHFERVAAALAGEPVDRVPIAFWRHHPGVDSRTDEFAEASLQWQERFEWDLMKITPGAGYSYEPWGVSFVYPGKDPVRVSRGIREVVEASRPVRTVADWAKIGTLRVRENAVLGQQILATEAIVRSIGRKYPTLQTIMSPAYTVLNVAGRDRFLSDVRSDSGKVLKAFEAVADATIALCNAFLDAGVTGLFFSTFLAAPSYFTPAEYRDLCMPFDLQVLQSVRSRSEILVNHVHGSDVYFDMLVDYPVDAVNWEDQTTLPSLVDGRESSGKCVIGGISEAALLGGREQVRHEVESAVAATGGRGTIVGAGCVIPAVTPDITVLAARQAAWEAPVAA